MSVQEEIDRINSAKVDIVEAIENKGVAVSGDAKIDALSSYINGIQQQFLPDNFIIVTTNDELQAALNNAVNATYIKMIGTFSSGITISGKNIFTIDGFGASILGKITVDYCQYFRIIGINGEDLELTNYVSGSISNCSFSQVNLINQSGFMMITGNKISNLNLLNQNAVGNPNAIVGNFIGEIFDNGYDQSLIEANSIGNQG